MTGERGRGEGGYTLAEVLLALVIIGTAVVAVLTGVAAATRTSNVSESASEADTYLRAQAEAYRAAVQAQCSVSGTTTFAPAAVTPPTRGSAASPVTVAPSGSQSCPSRGSELTLTLTATTQAATVGTLKVALRWW